MGASVPCAVVRQAVVYVCADAVAASRSADRAASRSSVEWLDAATARGVALAHRIVSGRTASALGAHDEPLVALSRLEGRW